MTLDRAGGVVVQQDVIHGVECYEAWREEGECPHEGHRFQLVQYHPTGEYGWDCRCSCGWDSHVAYRADQEDQARDMWLLVHMREVRRG